MKKLQPFFIFRAEATRVNKLYWLSQYAYSRTAAIIRALASVGHVEPDPVVKRVWPSIVDGENRQITVTATALTNAFDGNVETLRLTSVLYACSAFETALCNYFALCALYQPKRALKNWSGLAVPGVLANQAEFETLVQEACTRAGSLLRGKYSGRIALLASTFNLSLSSLPNLDNYYTTRHLVAHDQGLKRADAPHRSAQDVLASRAVISEADWRALAKDFYDAVTTVDSEVQRLVVTDGGLAMAIHDTLSRGGSMTVGELRFRLSSVWKLDESYQTVYLALKAMGRTVSGQRAIHRRIVS